FERLRARIVEVPGDAIEPGCHRRRRHEVAAPTSSASSALIVRRLHLGTRSTCTGSTACTTSSCSTTAAATARAAASSASLNRLDDVALAVGDLDRQLFRGFCEQVVDRRRPDGADGIRRLIEHEARDGLRLSLLTQRRNVVEDVEPAA